MAEATMYLDPNATTYTDDQIVDKVNTATTQITRAASVAAAARPLVDGEVTAAKEAAGVAKANLDAMSDTDRGYIKTAPVTGQFKVTKIQRAADGKLDVKYDNVAV